MRTAEPIAAADDQHKPKKLIRSQYKDVMVKVDEDVYYLDRLQLALKSGYFEKLFIEDYSDKNSNLIEIPLMDTDTFSTVVDVIYGEELHSVLNADNFVSLLMAMDYLQMDIDPETYKSFANRQLRWGRFMNKDIFKLYYFIADDANYEYLLPIVFHHLSHNFEKLLDRDEILSIKIDHIIKIISDGGESINGYSKLTPFRTVSKLCARWICHDMENRLHHALNLVNAARFRFHFSNKISHQNFDLGLSSNKDHLNQDSISTLFHKWMMYCGEIRCPEAVNSDILETECACDQCKHHGSESGSDTKKAQLFLFSREPKLESFLKNGHFYDITVKAGERVYKLHRSVLKSECLYFEEIFSKQHSELAAQCDGLPPNPPSKDEIYSLDEIDSATFDIIVNHLYLGKVEPTCDIIVRLLKAVHFLRIDSLKKPCCTWVQSNSDDMGAKEVVEILNFTHAHADYKNLDRFFLSKYIVDSYPKIDNLPQFADLFKAIALPEGTHSTDENKAYYLFDKVDQETFKLIIDYIYFDKMNFEPDKLVRLLKASHMFKIDKLMALCISDLKLWCNRMSSSDTKEVLNLSLEHFQYDEVLNTIYLVQYMRQWPQVDVELFRTISYDCLENMLLSYDLYFNDPRDLLDICSKWVVHDAENRYRLVPRIALAISQNCVANCDDYSAENPSTSEQCTQDFVRNKIWEILSSTSVLPFPLFSKNDAKKQKTDPPVFATSHKGKAFRIYNYDWDEIVSFCLCENMPEILDSSMRYPMAATIVNDNLFILCTMHKKSFFYIYSLSLKKLYSLASDRRFFKTKNGTEYGSPLQYTLLNCRNEIYCCFDNGEILQYSFEFNRWKLFSAAVPGKFGIHFASDGSKLFRMYETSQTDATTTYGVQVYDFSQTQWSSVANTPDLTRHHDSYDNSEKDRTIRHFVILNNYGFAASFHNLLYVFDQETRIWENVRSLPYSYENVVREHSIISQNEADEILYVNINKLYQYSATDRVWTLKKEWPLLKSKSVWAFNKILPYGNIISIHNPRIRAT